jgi:hypothetical protein
MTLLECEAERDRVWDEIKEKYKEIDRLTALSFRLREQEPGNRVSVKSRFLTRVEFEERWGDRQMCLGLEDDL